MLATSSGHTSCHNMVIVMVKVMSRWGSTPDGTERSRAYLTTLTCTFPQLTFQPSTQSQEPQNSSSNVNKVGQSQACLLKTSFFYHA
jgi:hypothetical protein